MILAYKKSVGVSIYSAVHIIAYTGCRRVPQGGYQPGGGPVTAPDSTVYEGSLQRRAPGTRRGTRGCGYVTYLKQQGLNNGT